MHIYVLTGDGFSIVCSDFTCLLLVIAPFCVLYLTVNWLSRVTRRRCPNNITCKRMFLAFETMNCITDPDSFEHCPDGTGHPRQPTSAWNKQQRPWRASFSSQYFELLRSWASSQPSSNGTVRSMMTIFLSSEDHRTMSGRSVVWIASGLTSLRVRSTFICHTHGGNRLIRDLFGGNW